MKLRLAATLALGTLASASGGAKAQTVAELQKQINELKALVKAQSGAPAPRRGAHADAKHHEAAVGAPPPADHAKVEHLPKAWFERLSIRGYTQVRGNEIIDGDKNAPAGISRLRSVHDSGIQDKNNFTFRRVRVIIQGDLHERVFVYIQSDLAVNVANQAATNQPRGNFSQLRDAFVDVFLDDEKTTKVRVGQQKIPFGWENLQSSQNRLTLDRSDAINSGIPGERDFGMTAYYTPPAVQHVWDRLAKDGQKLFGNYGAFGIGIYNGQTINRTEVNNDLKVVGMATWPIELDGLGELWRGQVLEVGTSGYRNEFHPELSTGGVSSVGYDDQRIGVHAILYPQPFGLQAEYNWGIGPEFDTVRRVITTKSVEGGYIQAMYRVEHSPIGQFYPYIRLQTYNGGWKVNLNAPRLETDELEVGVEFSPIKPIELTLAYARMKRREADTTRLGRAEGDVFRAQLQFNY